MPNEHPTLQPFNESEDATKSQSGQGDQQRRQEQKDNARKDAEADAKRQQERRDKK